MRETGRAARSPKRLIRDGADSRDERSVRRPVVHRLDEGISIAGSGSVEHAAQTGTVHADDRGNVAQVEPFDVAGNYRRALRHVDHAERVEDRTVDAKLVQDPEIGAALRRAIMRSSRTAEHSRSQPCGGSLRMPQLARAFGRVGQRSCGRSSGAGSIAQGEEERETVEPPSMHAPKGGANELRRGGASG